MLKAPASFVSRRQSATTRLAASTLRAPGPRGPSVISTLARFAGALALADAEGCLTPPLELSRCELVDPLEAFRVDQQGRQPHHSALVPDGGAGRVDDGRPLEHGEDLDWLVLMLSREGHLERIAHGVAGRDYGAERKELNGDGDYASTSDGQFLIGGLIVLASPPRCTTTRQWSKLGCHSRRGMSSERPALRQRPATGRGGRPELADLDLVNCQLRVRRGKGRKPRPVPLRASTLPALQDWLEVHGPEPGSLFCAVLKNGRLVRARRGSCSRRVGPRPGRSAKNAGARPVSRRPHPSPVPDLDRDLLEARVDLPTVQKMAGHDSVSTTGRNDRRDHGVQQKAAGQLDVPYVAPED
jgi:integrase-like protein